MTIATPHTVLVTTSTVDADDARDLVRWALEASEVLGPCEVVGMADCVVMTRERAERLILLAQKAHDWSELRWEMERANTMGACPMTLQESIKDAHEAVWSAATNLKPGDLDPLP